MLEWLSKILDWFTTRDGDDREDLRRDLATVRSTYRDLLQMHQSMVAELRQDISALRDEVATMAASLEAEKNAHKECQRKITDLTAVVRDLKAQVSILVARDEQRLTDGENKHGTP